MQRQERSASVTPTSTTMVECMICAEEVNRLSVISACDLDCCHQFVCPSCLYRHIVSIWEEGMTGQGRSMILCPMGCGQEVTDTIIRRTISHQNPPSILRRIVGTALQFLLYSIGVFFGLDSWAIQLVRSYHMWRFWKHSQKALRDLERYELWSLTVALRRIKCVMHCPAPNCNYQWIYDPSYRKHKQRHERRPTYLWYSPPKPERVPYNWVEPEFLRFDATGKYLDLETRDGRRMVCAKCTVAFCGLCKQPWEVGRKCHAGKSCQRFSRCVPSDADYSFVAQMQDCRSCPGCSLRTHRTAGCNHMTCPCGTEWCYVCETAPWRNHHYACVDRRGGNVAVNGGRAANCQIM